MSKLVSINEKIAKKVVAGYERIESGIVNGYKKIENGIVLGFNKVSDKCIEKLFSRDGESVSETRARLLSR